MSSLNSNYGHHANESIELGNKTSHVEAERKLLDIITSPWELMDPQTKNDSDKTQDIRMPYVGNGYF